MQGKMVQEFGLALAPKPEIARVGSGVRPATVLIQTERHTYLGTLQVPDGKARISDVLCDGRPFLDLTDVSTDGASGLDPVLVLNKAAIHCLRIVGVAASQAGHPAPIARGSL